MTLQEWLEVGYKSGFCGPTVCAEHDGTPLTADEESDEWDEEAEQWTGKEFCVPIVRIYEDAETRTAVEANHAPSVWRATNEGLTG